MSALAAIDAALNADRRLTLKEIDDLHKARDIFSGIIDAAATVLVGKVSPINQRTRLVSSIDINSLRAAIERAGGAA